MVAGLTALCISGCLEVVDSPVSVFRIHMRILSFLLLPLLQVRWLVVDSPVCVFRIRMRILSCLLLQLF